MAEGLELNDPGSLQPNHSVILNTSSVRAERTRPKEQKLFIVTDGCTLTRDL